MSETKFTPGPWRVEDRGPGLRVLFAGDASPRPTPCIIMDGTEQERVANAALIAAAPDLYAALDALASAGRGAGIGDDQLARIATDTLLPTEGRGGINVREAAALVLARAALARARGESQP